MPVLEYCSAMCCSAAVIGEQHIAVIDHPVSGVSFLIGVCLSVTLFISHRSAAVLRMLYKISNPMHPLYGALPVSYVPMRVTRWVLVAHRYTYALPRCRTSQCRMIFIHLSVSLWNDLPSLSSMVWDWRVSRTEPMLFYWSKLLAPFLSFTVFSSFYRLV